MEMEGWEKWAGGAIFLLATTVAMWFYLSHELIPRQEAADELRLAEQRVIQLATAKVVTGEIVKELRFETVQGPGQTSAGFGRMKADVQYADYFGTKRIVRLTFETPTVRPDTVPVTVFKDGTVVVGYPVILADQKADWISAGGLLIGLVCIMLAGYFGYNAIVIARQTPVGK